jgi:hypothetical protein
VSGAAALGQEHELEARAVRSIANVLDDEARLRQPSGDLVAAPEPKGGVGDHLDAIPLKPEHLTERDQREVDVGQVGPGRDASRVARLELAVGQLPRPPLPSAPSRVPSLEHQPASWAQRVVRGGERPTPLPVGDEDLRHVARHHREVDLQRWQVRHRAVDPPDAVRAGLAACHVQRCLGGVQRDDLGSAEPQPARQRSRATPDIEDR